MDRTRKSFNVCKVNARSLRAPSHLLDLEILSDYSVDVLCITETWLLNSKSSQSISLPDFQLPFRKDRNVSPGGGVAIYICTGIAARIIPIPDNTEVICIQLMISRRAKLNVISAYRTPGPNAEVFFQQMK